MSVVVPTAIYVGVMPFTGLYLASIVFIGWFMRWLGKYRWVTVLAVALGMPIVTYFIFDRTLGKRESEPRRGGWW